MWNVNHTFKDFDRFFVGFDPLVKKITEAAEQTVKLAQNYPPYNIKKIDENKYTIEMAVAGFGKQNLDIELKEDVLTITGSHDATDADYIYQGIANRAFTRKFTLADTVVVKNAELVNGLLKIMLERFVPEEKKAKRIEIFDPFGIAENSKQLLNEGVKTWTDGLKKVAEAVTPK